MVITVYAASCRDLDKVYFDAAFNLGELIAKRGHSMVYGGGGSGLMGAAARGAASGNGSIIGVAPRFFDEPGVLFEGNTRMLLTETMGERKKLMEDMAEAFVILPGGIGTLEEFFEALTLKQLGRHAKAMAVLNVNGCYDALDAMMRRGVEERFIPQEGYGLYETFTDPEPLMDYIESYKAECREIWKEKLFAQKYPGQM